MIKEKLEISKFKMLCIFIMIYQIILLIPVINKQVSLTGLMALFILPELFISYRIVRSINCIRNFKVQDISKIFIYVIVSIIFLGAYIFELIHTENNNKRAFIILAVLSIILVIEFILFRLMEITYKINDRQFKWKAAINSINNIDENITIWWSLKIWWNPKFDIKDLPKNPRREKWNIVMYVLMLVWFISYTKLGSYLYIIIFIYLISLKQPRYIFDKLFGTYVKTTGLCVGMQDISDPSNGNYIYSYRIVDFNNKREVDIRMYGIENRNFYSQGDKVTVIHGAISKMVLHHYITY